MYMYVGKHAWHMYVYMYVLWGSQPAGMSGLTEPLVTPLMGRAAAVMSHWFIFMIQTLGTWFYISFTDVSVLSFIVQLCMSWSCSSCVSTL